LWELKHEVALRCMSGRRGVDSAETAEMRETAYGLHLFGNVPAHAIIDAAPVPTYTPTRTLLVSLASVAPMASTDAAARRRSALLGVGLSSRWQPASSLPSVLGAASSPPASCSLVARSKVHAHDTARAWQRPPPPYALSGCLAQPSSFADHSSQALRGCTVRGLRSNAM